MIRPVHYSTKMIEVPRYISVRCVGNGDSWPGQHHSFGPRSSLDFVPVDDITVPMNLIYLSWVPPPDHDGS